jgi:hypothetical protein
LPLSGCSGSLSSVSRPVLSVEISGLMCVGVAFAVLGAGGLFWAFDNDDRKWRKTSVTNSSFSLNSLLFFYNWAFFGHPANFLGLN